MAEPAIEPSKNERGQLYWLVRHTLEGLRAFVGRHKLASVGIVVVALVLLFWQRAAFQPHLLAVRKFSFLLPLLLPFVMGLWWVLRKRAWQTKSIVWAVLVVAVVFAWEYEAAAYRYCKLYLHYRALEKTVISRLPTTDHERIQPLNSVHTLALENIVDTEAPTVFHFVRIGDEYRFTAAIEPAHRYRRMFESVVEVFSIPGTTASANFSKENRARVQFNEGENLWFSRNIRTAVRRAFGPFRLWSYEPADVFCVQDDSGEWVQVVSLIRWTGIVFPRPEFGGVHVVRQKDDSVVESFRRALFGSGEWIPPNEIAEHRYLLGQNTVPYRVSRFAASSFRFQSGFWAPFPGYHRGDIRIPDLPGDQNDQPFTVYFRLAFAEGGADKLYDYFALEPFDPDKQGLNTSVFYPSDGIGPVFVYEHYKESGVISGVSTIATKVMESRKNYDWSRHRPVEHQPYIRDIAGRTRFFWRSTVVTLKDPSEPNPETGEQGSETLFIAGAAPEVVLTDAEYKTPVWVDALDPARWPATLEETLNSIWE